MKYAFNVVSLWATRKISFQTVLYALREKPIAVAGRGGGYIVEPSFDL